MEIRKIEIIVRYYRGQKEGLKRKIRREEYLALEMELNRKLKSLCNLEITSYDEKRVYKTGEVLILIENKETNFPKGNKKVVLKEIILNLEKLCKKYIFIEIKNIKSLKGEINSVPLSTSNSEKLPLVPVEVTTEEKYLEGRKIETTSNIKISTTKVPKGKIEDIIESYKRNKKQLEEEKELYIKELKTRARTGTSEKIVIVMKRTEILTNKLLLELDTDLRLKKGELEGDLKNYVNIIYSDKIELGNPESKKFNIKEKMIELSIKEYVIFETYNLINNRSGRSVTNNPDTECRDSTVKELRNIESKIKNIIKKLVKKLIKKHNYLSFSPEVK